LACTRQPWPGKKWRLAHGIALLLEWPFHAEKTCSKPLNRAIYTIVFRLINGLRWSDPQPSADLKETVKADILQTECAFVDGYSNPGKLIEIEVTATVE
jgi:hypothetical protein